MTTDRELLELAAKAAGMNAEWHNIDDADYDAEHEGMWLKGARTADNNAYWNPLADDADALRLAVKLGMIVRCPVRQDGRDCASVTARGINFQEQDDPFIAVRRAIVRAAAEIGKAMP